MAPQNQPSWFDTWLTPQPLFHLPGLRSAYGPGDEGGAEIGSRFKQCPSLWLGTEDQLHERTSDLLGFIRWDFEFDRTGYWHKQRPSFGDLFRRFFRRTSDLPAWLSIVPVRKPLEYRLGITASKKRCAIPAPKMGKAISLGREQKTARLAAELGKGVGRVLMGSINFGYRPGEKFGKASLIQVGRSRIIPDAHGNAQVAIDTIIYLAQEGRDDLATGRVPAIDVFHDEKRRLNMTPSVVLAKLETPEHPWLVRQLVITFWPDGKTAALAPGCRSLGAFLDQYPLEATLLVQASVSKPHG